MGSNSVASSQAQSHRHHRHTDPNSRITQASRFRLGSFSSSIYIIASLLALITGFLLYRYPESTHFSSIFSKTTPRDSQGATLSASTHDASSLTTAPAMASIRRVQPLTFPAIGRHTATVIFAHGLGDSGSGWASAVEHWRRRQNLNEVKFILPNAPDIPITVNGGFRMPGWFDIVALGGSAAELRTKGANEDGPGILTSREYFNSLIQEEISAGIPSERIVLGGFSQGGAMSIFTGVTSPVKLAGIVGLSSWLLLNQKIKEHIPEGNFNKDTPIFMGHGDQDQVVRHELGTESQKILKGLGYDVKLETYRGMAHSAVLEELDEVEKFLVSRLPAKGN